MKLNGIPEMVNEYNGILVPPRAANELAEAITTVMRSPERFNRSSIASNAQKRYSVEAVADQILEVYNEVLLEHRSG
jgi:glycosyltransferase involved in cell wall biosynthesis